jgi:aldehyde:ferredoxin oxidoreductase
VNRVGEVLHVELDSGKSWRETIPEDWVRDYLGSRGFNARLLWDQLAPDTDAFSPENPLILGAGLLTGTHAPSSGRVTLTSKSPATGRYFKTSGGGQWGAQLRYAGYSSIVVHGGSEEPVYLHIDDDRVEVRPAGHIWGMDVPTADAQLKAEANRRGAQTMCIGPAGENLVRFASVMSSVHHAAGRGGLGAVMGSKKLKAVVVSGTQGVEPARPQEFHELVSQIREDIPGSSGVERYYRVGTAGSVIPVSAMGAFPARNFTRGQIANAYALSGQRLVEDGYLKRRVACFSCPISCHRYTEIDAGRYAGLQTGGPEYETLAAIGGLCGLDDLEDILKANELCNSLGLDTISTGSVIGWFMECYQRGIVEEYPGEPAPAWGNAEAVIALVEQIATRKGSGDLLAEGSARASQTIGHDSYKWAVQARGLEQSSVDTRASKAYALAFAVNPRGPDHLHAQPMAEMGRHTGAVELIARITGDANLATPRSTEKRAEIVRWHEDVFAVTDSLGLCAFVSTSAYPVTPELMARMVSAFTGYDMTGDEIMRVGRRTINLERCLNVRWGQTRADDRLPWRMMNEESPEHAGFSNSAAELDGMLDEYYALQGWDKVEGKPTAATLRELGLADIGAEIGIS